MYVGEYGYHGRARDGRAHGDFASYQRSIWEKDFRADRTRSSTSTTCFVISNNSSRMSLGVSAVGTSTSTVDNIGDGGDKVTISLCFASCRPPFPPPVISASSTYERFGGVGGEGDDAVEGTVEVQTDELDELDDDVTPGYRSESAGCDMDVVWAKTRVDCGVDDGRSDVDC
jgi:hypothetical protein